MVLIYESTVTGIPTDNGLGGLSPSECIVTEEINGDFSLSMIHPMDDDGKWKKIAKSRILLVPTHRGDQLFRIYSVDTDIIKGSVVVDARHIFYDLLDNFVETVGITKLQGEAAGDAVLTGCQYASGFTWTSSITKIKTASYKRMNPVQAIMGDLPESIVRRWGGELARDNYSISHVTRLGASNGARVTYAKNMTALRMTEDIREAVTRIYPTVQGAGNTIYVLPEKYVDSANIADYPAPLVAWYKIDGINPGDEDYPTSTEIYAEMRIRCAELFASGIDQPSATFEAGMVDLSKTEEYGDVVALESVEIGDTVTVKYTPLSILLALRVVAVKWDSLLGRYDSLTIGKRRQNLANYESNVGTRVTTLENQMSNDWFDEYSLNIIPCYESQVQAAINSYNIAIMQEGHIGKGAGGGTYNVAVGPFTEIDGDDNVVLGDAATATGDCNVSAGSGAGSTGSYDISIGFSSNATGNDLVLIGRDGYSGGSENTSIGSTNKVYTDGTENTLVGNHLVAGVNGVTKTDQSVIAGNQITIVRGTGHVAIGDAPVIQGASDSIAIGHAAAVYGTSNIAMGDGAISGLIPDVGEDRGNVAIGDGAIAKGGSSVALGDNTVAHGLLSTALGNSAEAYGTSNMAIGNGSEAGAEADSGQSGNIAIGDSSKAYGGDSNTALGYHATVSEIAIDRNTALGAAARVAGGSDNIIVGAGYTDGNRNIVIGNGIIGTAIADDDNILIGMSTGVASTSRPVIQGKSTEGISFMAQAVDKVPLRSELLEGQTANAYSVLDFEGTELGGISADGGSIKIIDQSSGVAVKTHISTLTDLPAESERVAGTKYLVELTDAEVVELLAGGECAEVRLDEFINGVPGELELAMAAFINGGT